MPALSPIRDRKDLSMKLKITNNPLKNTPQDIREVVDTYVRERARYMSRLKLRGRDPSEALVRLMPALVLRLEDAGCKDNWKTKQQARDYLGCKYLGVKPPKGKYTYVYHEPQVAQPVVTYNPDIEVGPLWTEAIQILNNRGVQLDETMAQAVCDHRAALVDIGTKQSVKDAEAYLPLAVQGIYVEMSKVDDPTHMRHDDCQISGRLNGGDAQGADVVGSKWSRALFLTAEAKRVNTRARKFFEEKLKEHYSIDDVGAWASSVIDAYDVSSHKKGEELSHALGWWDIITEGKTQRIAEFDAHTSGMAHMKLQTGNWKRVDIDSKIRGWIKLYTHVGKRMKTSPYIGHLTMAEILKEAKKAMATSQYGGGGRAIATQYIKDVAYDRKKKEWIIPSGAREQIPELYYELFETNVYEGEVLPMPVLDDLQEGLERFYKEVLKPHFKAFVDAFPWITDLNSEMIAWSEENAGKVIQYKDGFQRRIPRVKINRHGTKIKLNLYDAEGYRYPTGVLPMEDSSFTEGLAMETHHLDALQMVLLIIRGGGACVDIFPILDAACVNIADLEWLEINSGETFLEVHSEPHFPVGTEGFKPWTGDTPVVWGM
jgi:hypothetical protein